ncbi:hypothetical protein [Lacticaseibacillus manihotivorans]|uniref:hypothetical protein n=1 Tax=Lacticaseibacillus manihotivorans TaxID=88233 RepID=UPI0006CF8835|nr:hypothetical protein [Lacticaseibacillus manihotivorans]
MAHGWGFAAADMSPLVEYALILVVYLCIPVIFITGKRYRHAYHLANQMLQHRRSVIDLMIFTVGFGVVAQWAGWPEWIGLVSVAIIAGGLTYYWHRTDVHHAPRKKFQPWRQFAHSSKNAQSITDFVSTLS